MVGFIVLWLLQYLIQQKLKVKYQIAETTTKNHTLNRGSRPRDLLSRIEEKGYKAIS